ncbi:MAG: hypothetical protein ACKOPM_03605 [Novosphingobium sp.]
MNPNDPMEGLPSPALRALYRPQAARDWALTIEPMVFSPGYWGAARLVEELVALLRGDDVWMSLAPLELESQAIGIAAARGHVVVMGLGLGWAAAECALRDTVDLVTVIEADPAVIALHRDLDLFARLPEQCGGKVRIVPHDAMTWRTDRTVDVMIADIWLPLIGADDRAAEVRQMQANVAAQEVYFWGQELELARQAVARGLAIDAAGIAAVADTWGLPLVGPETPDYATRTRAAAKAWMRGRWLPGTENPFA